MPETDDQGRDMTCPDPRCFICGLEIEQEQYSLHISWHESLVRSKFPGSIKEIDISSITQVITDFQRLQNDYWQLQAKCADMEGQILKLEAANNVMNMGLSQVEAVIGTEGNFRFVEKPAPPVKVYPLPTITGHTPYVARSANG
jgi:hypothetical protein